MSVSVQAGILNWDSQPIDRKEIAAMGRWLADYGPDGESSYLNGSISMLYRPFFTTPESVCEVQPHLSASGKVITWDGRLDNRDELVLELACHLGDDCTDLALFSAAFEQWGTNCFAKLRGDWATAIWIPEENELILARDFAGVRHLFYHPQPRRIIWCSHLAPLVRIGDRLHVCEEYFAGYLLLWPPAHLTPYREICSVPPGSYLCAQGGHSHIQQYWDPNPTFKIRFKADVEYEEQFRDVFAKAVRRRLRTNSPILADLSGGLDSSSIVCVADQVIAQGQNTTPRIDTFSISDRSEPGDEDLFFYTKVEEQRGRVGHHADVLATGDSLSFEYADFVPTPGFGDREEVNTIKSKLIREHGYRVSLSGLGGDEIAGNTLDPCVQAADLIRALRLRSLSAHLQSWSLLLRRPWLELFCASFAFLLPPAIRTKTSFAVTLEPWINDNFARKHNLPKRKLNAAEGSWLEPAGFRDSLQTLLVLSRQLTCKPPSSIEARYPFLDQDLVEFLMHIPSDQLLRPNQRRSLMRRSLAHALPSSILQRRTKSAGGRCFALTLDKHWGLIERALQSPILETLGWVKHDKLLEAAQLAKLGQIASHFFQVLNCISAELWLRDTLKRGYICLDITTAPVRRRGQRYVSIQQRMG